MPVFDKNNLIAIANKIIPKNFFNIWIPASPNIFSKKRVDLNTKNTKIIFKVIAISISKILYSDFKEISVVIDPAPAIRGKATGTIAVLSVLSYLKSCIPNISSIPRINNTKDPAIAKEDTSTPKRLSKGSPINKNKSIRTNATIDVRKGLTLPVFFFISRIIGMDPVISITAKRTIKTVKTLTRLNFIILRFKRLRYNIQFLN